MLKFKTQFVQPENTKERIFIPIPFNLWDEFGKKGMFDVDLDINGVQIRNVGLLPRGNGMYSIRFTKQLQKTVKAAYLVELDIAVSLSEEKIKEERKNPKEYRNISKVTLVQQSTDGNCGQACVSMLTGIGLEKVCQVMHTSGSTTIGQIINALDEFGIRHAEKNVRISKKNPHIPEIAILTVHFPEYTHWVLYYKGKYFDPEFGEFKEYTKGKITSFLECFDLAD